MQLDHFTDNLRICIPNKNLVAGFVYSKSDLTDNRMICLYKMSLLDKDGRVMCSFKTSTLDASLITTIENLVNKNREKLSAPEVETVVEATTTPTGPHTSVKRIVTRKIVPKSSLSQTETVKEAEIPKEN